MRCRCSGQMACAARGITGCSTGALQSLSEFVTGPVRFYNVLAKIFERVPQSVQVCSSLRVSGTRLHTSGHPPRFSQINTGPGEPPSGHEGGKGSKIRAMKELKELLAKADVAIYNARTDPDLSMRLAQYGYDDMRLGEGRTLYDRVNTLYHQQKHGYGQQYDATDKLHRLWEQADVRFYRDRRVAKVVFRKHRGARQSLGLVGERKGSLTHWLRGAQQFYNNALQTPYQTQLAEYGLTMAHLSEGRALVQEVVEAKRVSEAERGAAQQSTKERDAAMKALREWMTDFMEIATVALEDMPQYLEKLMQVEES